MKKTMSSKKNTKMATVGMPIFLVVLSVVLIGGYWYIDRNAEKTAIKNQTEVELLLSKDLDNFYPSTPRSVVLFFGRIMQCIYTQNITEAELRGLVELQQKLFDDELLEINPIDTFYKSAYIEWQTFKENKTVFEGYQADRASNVQTWKKDGTEYASLTMYYSLRGDGGVSADYNEFILRKDEQNKWKILGWRTVEPKELEME